MGVGVGGFDNYLSQVMTHLAGGIGYRTPLIPTAPAKLTIDPSSGTCQTHFRQWGNVQRAQLHPFGSGAVTPSLGNGTQQCPLFPLGKVLALGVDRLVLEVFTRNGDDPRSVP